MDENEFNRLKNEAERRMKEIHAGSRPENESKEDHKPQQETENKPEHSPREVNKEKESLFTTLFKDQDKTIILALILLLAGDKEGKPDYSLLLALIYILL